MRHDWKEMLQSVVGQGVSPRSTAPAEERLHYAETNHLPINSTNDALLERLKCSLTGGAFSKEFSYLQHPGDIFSEKFSHPSFKIFNWANNSVGKMTEECIEKLQQQAQTLLNSKPDALIKIMPASFYEEANCLFKEFLDGAVGQIHQIINKVPLSKEHPHLFEYCFLLIGLLFYKFNKENPAKALRQLHSWCNEMHIRQSLFDAQPLSKQSNFQWMSALTSKLHSPLARALVRLAAIQNWIENGARQFSKKSLRNNKKPGLGLWQIMDARFQLFIKPPVGIFQRERFFSLVLNPSADQGAPFSPALSQTKPVGISSQKLVSLTDLTTSQPKSCTDSAVAAHADPSHHASVEHRETPSKTDDSTAVNSARNNPLKRKSEVLRYGVDSPWSLEEICRRMNDPGVSNLLMITLATWALPPMLSVEEVNRYRSNWISLSDHMNFGQWLGSLHKTLPLQPQIDEYLQQRLQQASPYEQFMLSMPNNARALSFMAETFLQHEQSGETVQALESSAQALVATSSSGNNFCDAEVPVNRESVALAASKQPRVEQETTKAAVTENFAEKLAEESCGFEDVFTPEELAWNLPLRTVTPALERFSRVLNAAVDQQTAMLYSLSQQTQAEPIESIEPTLTFENFLPALPLSVNLQENSWVDLIHNW